MREYGWHLVENGDPAPGQPDGIRRVGATFTAIADTAAEARSALVSIRDGELCSCWQGKAARRYGDQLEKDFIVGLQQLADSFREAGSALKLYSNRLAQLQRDADRYLRELKKAHEDEQRSKAAVTNAEGRRVQSLRQREGAERALSELSREYRVTLLHRSADDTTYMARYNAWRAKVLQQQNVCRAAFNAESLAARERADAECEVSSAQDRLKQATTSIKNVRADRIRYETQAEESLNTASVVRRGTAHFVDSIWKAVKRAANLVLDALDAIDKLIEGLALSLVVAAVVLTVVGVVLAPAALAVVAAMMPTLAGLTLAGAVTTVILAAAGRRTWTEAAVKVVFAALDKGRVFSKLGRTLKNARPANLLKRLTKQNFAKAFKHVGPRLWKGAQGAWGALTVTLKRLGHTSPATVARKITTAFSRDGVRSLRIAAAELAAQMGADPAARRQVVGKVAETLVSTGAEHTVKRVLSEVSSSERAMEECVAPTPPSRTPSAVIPLDVRLPVGNGPIQGSSPTLQSGPNAGVLQ